MKLRLHTVMVVGPLIAFAIWAAIECYRGEYISLIVTMIWTKTGYDMGYVNGMRFMKRDEKT